MTALGVAILIAVGGVLLGGLAIAANKAIAQGCSLKRKGARRPSRRAAWRWL